MQVNIRPLKKDDAKTSVKWRNDPMLWVHTKFRALHEVTLEDEQNWIIKVMNDPLSARFAIIVDEVYVGNIYLTDILKGTAEYHIFIGDRKYWGKGVARAASLRILSYGKDILKLKKISLLVKKENIGAYYLYSTLGFIESGNIDSGFSQMTLNLHEWNNNSRATMG